MPKPATATRFTGMYPGRPDQVRDARRAVARHLAGCPALDDAVLITSELASNAVLHSASRGEFFTVRASGTRITSGSRLKTSVAPGGPGSTMTGRTAWTWWKRSPARTAGEPNSPVTAGGSSGRAWTWRRGSEDIIVLLDGPAGTARTDARRITASLSQGPFRLFARCVTYEGAGTFQTSSDGEPRP